MEKELTIKEQIRQKVEAARPEIVEQAAQKAIEALKLQLSWEIESQLKQLVSGIFEEEILPELKEKVTQQKQSIINGLLEGFTDIGAEIAKALTAEATKNLSQSWNVGKLSDALFK